MPRWLWWSLLALVSWGVWAILSKLIGDALSPAQSQALSTLGMLPVMIALLSSKKLQPGSGKTRGIVFALVAGGLSCLGNVTYYEALNRGGKAATVVPLTALYPLVTTALALLLLKERLNRVQMVGVLVSLASIYLLNVPDEHGVAVGALGYALLPIAFWGCAGFFQKLSTNHASGELSTVWFLGAFIPAAAFILWREPLVKAVTPQLWMLVASLGFFFALGNYALLAAFASNGKASIITPLTGLYSVVSVPIAIGFFGERIGPRETVGILLALAAAGGLSWEGSAAKMPPPPEAGSPARS